MTKKEQFEEAILKNFGESEKRCQWLRTNLETYRNKAMEASQSPETGRDRTAELVAGMLAKQLADLEMLTIARCYLAYKELFKGDVRLHSNQLDPIVLEANQHKTLADLEAEAEAVTIAWNMMLEAKEKYCANITKLRSMLGTLRYNDEFKRFSVSAY